MAWDQRYRPLHEGETILATDEVQEDDCSWSPPNPRSIGKPAPCPYYTSHRWFRRRKA